MLPLDTRSTNRIGEAEPWRHLDGPRYVDEVDVDTALCKELARQARKDGGDPHAGQLLGRLHVALLGYGGLQRTASERELGQLANLSTPLANKVSARDPTVHHPILDVLGDVGGPHEQHVDRCVATGERQRPLARLLRTEPGRHEQLRRGLPQAPLGGNRDRQSAFSGPGNLLRANRYPPSPCLSQCATRVTVVVEAPLRRDTCW